MLYEAITEMRMRQRDGQRVGGIGAGELDPGQLQPHHMLDLPLVGMADADDGLLDLVRGVV